MSIEIPPRLEATLARQASSLGLSLQSYVERILAKQVRGSAGLTSEDVQRIAANDSPERRAVSRIITHRSGRLR